MGKPRIRPLKVTLFIDTGAQTLLDLHITSTRKHDTQSAPGLVGRNLDRFDVLSADKGYADRGLRKWLRSRGKWSLIRHREFAPRQHQPVAEFPIALDQEHEEGTGTTSWIEPADVENPSPLALYRGRMIAKEPLVHLVQKPLGKPIRGIVLA